jgi:O-antigen ligase
MVRMFVEAPRWLLVAGLIFAPWAYGSTRPWAIQGLSILMGCICLFWLAECLIRRRQPALSLIAVITSLGLIFQGWWMALNAHSYFDADLQALLPKAPLVSGAPGSADGPASASAMFFFTGLLGMFLFCCDLSQHPVWRKRIWMTVALTGLSLAAFGILQKIGGEAVLSLIWEPEKRDLTNNFATFRYRGNAGAYLNLIFPMMAGLAFLSFQRHDQHWRKVLWSSGLFVLVMGIQLNPSRASWFIGIILGLILGVKIFLSYGKRENDFTPKSVLVFAMTVALVLLAIGSISFLGNWETSWGRFNILGFNPADRSPTEIYLRMIPDAGVMGFGPGTFSTIFPSYQGTYDFGTRAVPLFWKDGFFEHAHEDYLETLIEWGYLGSLSWSVLVIGGIARGVMRYFQRQTSFSLRWLLLCSLLALGGTLTQALIDFPLQIASIQLYVFVLLGICWGTNSASARDTEPVASHRISRKARCAVRRRVHPVRK